MDRGAWWSTVHGFTKSRTGLHIPTQVRGRWWWAQLGIQTRKWAIYNWSHECTEQGQSGLGRDRANQDSGRTSSPILGERGAFWRHWWLSWYQRLRRAESLSQAEETTCKKEQRGERTWGFQRTNFAWIKWRVGVGMVEEWRSGLSRGVILQGFVNSMKGMA